MSLNQEIKAQAELIVRTHDGQMYFKLKEVSKIIGCGINTVPPLLHEQGIMITKVGTSKRVSAYDIAEVKPTHFA